MSGRRIAGLALLALALAIAIQAEAGAERTQRGHLIVAVNGTVRPNVLPRRGSAPVRLVIEGRIATDDGSTLPRLKTVALAIAGRGALDTLGLPVCRSARIANATSRQALRRCPGALVGSGRLAAQIVAPHQAPFALDARLLAFNGRGPRGEAAIWVHAYTPDPPISIVLPFIVRRDRGRLASTLVATVPRALGALPRVGGFKLEIGRRYTYRGEAHSLLSASCPAAPGFGGGFLTLVTATYRFADRRHPSIGPRLPRPLRGRIALSRRSLAAGTLLRIPARVPRRPRRGS